MFSYFIKKNVLASENISMSLLRLEKKNEILYPKEQLFWRSNVV